jgi:hypothetical protein
MERKLALEVTRRARFRESIEDAILYVDTVYGRCGESGESECRH